MSSRRDRTRLAILDAAWKRLSLPGDAARLEDVAADAGVTRQSVYLHFGTRAALLVALVQHVDETLGLGALVQELTAVEDPVERLERGLRLTARFQPRVHGIAMALGVLAATDPDARAAFEDRMARRREGLLHTLRVLKRQGRLARGWTAARAADALWEAGAPSSFQHLVVERGWSEAEFERWLVHLGRSLLVAEAR